MVLCNFVEMNVKYFVVNISLFRIQHKTLMLTFMSVNNKGHISSVWIAYHFEIACFALAHECGSSSNHKESCVHRQEKVPLADGWPSVHSWIGWKHCNHVVSISYRPFGHSNRLSYLLMFLILLHFTQIELTEGQFSVHHMWKHN